MSDDIPVQALRAAAYQIPTEVPEADGTLSWDKTVMVVVEAEAGGQRGIGWTYSTPAAAGVVTGVLTEVVAGRPALDVPGTNEAMYRAVRNLGRRGIAAAAISAADIALWDLKARLLGISVTSLLGHARPVPVYGSGGFTSYDNQQLRDQLSRWTGELKIPPRQDQDRRVVGDDGGPGPAADRAGARGNRPAGRAVRRRERRLHRPAGCRGGEADGRLPGQLV